MICSGDDAQVGEQLDQGYTLPTDWYLDQTRFQREREQIVRRNWHYVGLAEQVARPGDWFTIDLAGVSVIITCDAQQQLHALVNVCRHRGAQVMQAESGHRTTLQCHYHAWTYDLDGRLRAAPGMHDEESFDLGAFCLPRWQVATWGPFIFVHPDPAAPPLHTFLGELPGLVDATELDLRSLRRRVRRVYDIRANWKTVIENYLECYHCPVAHPGFCDLIDTNTYHIQEYAHFSTQTGSQKREGDRPYQSQGAVEDGFYAYLWPNFTLNIYPGPGNVSLNLFLPIAPDHTRAIYDYCFADAVSDAEVDEFVRFIDQVQDEDVVLCESVQRGLESGYFAQGRLMLSSERALRHFQRLVWRAMKA